MGYMHIDNLYKDQRILLFRECYAMEKIHGTGAHFGWNAGQLTIHSGEQGDYFASLFDRQAIAGAFDALGHARVTVFGEAYGGKCQGMRATYGDAFRFVAFEVQIGDAWLNVPNAEEVAKRLGFDFVSYVKIPTNLEAIDGERDANSVQAVLNGMGVGHKREGVVLRPIEEFRDARGNRVICKHKRDEFRETASPRKVEADPFKQKRLEDAEAIALEWVTDMRLQHVLQALEIAPDMTRTTDVIAAMREDIKREASGEVVLSPEAFKAIGARTGKLLREACKAALR